MREESRVVADYSEQLPPRQGEILGIITPMESMIGCVVIVPSPIEPGGGLVFSVRTG